MSIHTARVITQTLATIDEIGTPLPAPIRAALDETIRHATAMADWTPPNGGVVAAAFDAIKAGKDPLTDKGVAASLAAEALAERQGEIRAIGNERLANLARTHLGDIIASLTAAYDRRVVEPLTAAVETLARYLVEDPDTPADQVLRHGGEAAEAWNAAAAARRDHNEITARVMVLASTIGVRTTEKVYMYADPGNLTLDQVRRLGPNPDPWPAMVGGMKLGLVEPRAAETRRTVALENGQREQAAREVGWEARASREFRIK